MKTREQVLEAVAAGELVSRAIDGRDFLRLASFFEEKDLPKFDVVCEDDTPWQPNEWTESAVKEQLRADVAFGFEKALDARGLSASFMYYVVLMWMWVLEDELATFDADNYACYGLPLFKAVAVKYGFPNEIGEDSGSEEKYQG